MRLRFTNTDGIVLLLDSRGSSIRLQRVLGAGVPDVQHQTIKTPNRDGRQFTGRSILDERFVIAELSITDVCTTVQEAALRRTIAAALNPKVGMGTLEYAPDNTTFYQIPALLQRGAGFDANAVTDGFLRELALSFFCPDPAWVAATANSATIGPATGGLDIPLEIPLDIADPTMTEIINNPGDLDSFPTITVPGKIVDPIITNNTTGRVMAFNGLTVDAGDTLTINMNERTATVAGVSVMQYRTAESESWPFIPGDNSITIDFGAGTSITFTFTFNTRLVGV